MNEIISFLELNTPQLNKPYFAFHAPSTYWITVCCYTFL